MWEGTGLGVLFMQGKGLLSQKKKKKLWKRKPSKQTTNVFPLGKNPNAALHQAWPRPGLKFQAVLRRAEVFPERKKEYLKVTHPAQPGAGIWQEEREGKLQWKAQIRALSVNQTYLFINPELAH